MTNGEIISLIAVCLSFIGVLTSFLFSYKKATKERDQERESNIKNMAEIKNDTNNIRNNVDEIKVKVEKIDDKMEKDHDKLIEHENKIRNLEKEVFYKGGQNKWTGAK